MFDRALFLPPAIRPIGAFRLLGVKEAACLQACPEGRDSSVAVQSFIGCALLNDDAHDIDHYSLEDTSHFVILLSTARRE